MDALPPPTAEGLLAKTPLAHVLVYVMERRMTGSLELRRPDGGAGTVVFVEGIPHTATGKILKTALRDQFKAYSFPNAAA